MLERQLLGALVDVGAVVGLRPDEVRTSLISLFGSTPGSELSMVTLPKL